MAASGTGSNSFAPLMDVAGLTEDVFRYVSPAHVPGQKYGAETLMMAKDAIEFRIHS